MTKLANRLTTIMLIMACYTPSLKAQTDKDRLIEAHRMTYLNVVIEEENKSGNQPSLKLSGEHINHKLEMFTDSCRKIFASIKSIPGYRILVYNGNEREKANSVKKKLYTQLVDPDVYIQFKQPAFRVMLGDYYDKLACLQMLDKIKKDFPQAVIIPDAVFLKRQ